MNQNYTIVVCGASRVGKSTLINALVGKDVAKTSSSLQPCTAVIQKYVLERYGESTAGPIKYHIEFWDTPGVEKWVENDVRLFLSDIIKKTNPICVIYCASPNSFAVPHQVSWFVGTCISQEIFVALVCTNMHAGPQTITEDFMKIVNNLRLPGEWQKENNVFYYDRKVLCAQVNSRPFVNTSIGISMGVSGLEELMFGITKCLSADKQLIWLRTIADNETFWPTMAERLTNLLKIPMPSLVQLWGQARGLANYFRRTVVPTVTTTVEVRFIISKDVCIMFFFCL